MEQSKNDSMSKRGDLFDNRSSRVWGGVLLIVLGIIFFADRSGADIPDWVISWETIIIVLGIYIGARHQFRPGVWMVMLLVGTVFLIDDFMPEVRLTPYLWPTILVGIGLFMILRPRGRRHPRTSEEMGDESIDVVSVFGGSKRHIISKDFKGGYITSCFGGTDLNLMQADFKGEVVLDITNVFGGTKIVMPPNWRLRSEIVTVFGGTEDKRGMATEAPDMTKTLVLRGTCIFGGIDIKGH